ncbi:MAG: CPBP family intramembrane glutamic endopeptidase [Pirellulaceae bacterium]
MIPATIVFATLIGLYLGYVAWKTGSIWPTVVGHLAINSGINFFRMVVKFAELSEPVQQGVAWTAVVISSVCCIVTIWHLSRRDASA